MGTYADDNNSTGLHFEDSLIESFKNVGLKSNDHEGYGSLDDSGSYPLRPYAEDCSHYLRTGTCKFGLSCRFNHPVKRTNLVGRDRDKESNFEKSEGQIECKSGMENLSTNGNDLELQDYIASNTLLNLSEEFTYKSKDVDIENLMQYYLTTGGCKYGESCKYSHYKDQSEVPVPDLNFLGLPIRMGEKVCPFYMRHGSCGYGARCIFHHPDPTSLGGSNSHNSALNHKSVGQPGYSSAISTGESGPLHMSGASRSDHASWSSHMPSGWEGYQVPDDLHGRNRNRFTTPAPSSFVRMGAASLQVEEYPERPGQPECDYFLKTGDCKFKSACRFHHPKDRIPKPEMCILSDKGLPLRPGKSICRHYERYGICKFGRACLFDHPVNHDSSTYPDWSSSEPMQIHDTGYWDN